MARTPPTRARSRSLSATVRAAAATAVTAAAVTAAGPLAATPAAAAPVPEAARALDPDGGPVEVTPRRVAPGTQVRVRLGSCAAGRTATATSVAFDADVELTRTPGGSALHGSALVNETAEPGTYGITAVCGATAREGSFTVVPASGGGHGDHGDRPDGARHHESPQYASPVAPVRAGGGGTAGERPGAGAETAQRIGLTLAGGAAIAGTAVWAVRRRPGAHAGG